MAHRLHLRRGPRRLALGVLALFAALMLYAGWLTSGWKTLVENLPAVVVMTALVSALAIAVTFYGEETE